MAHIQLPTEDPGIIGLLRYRPETAGPLTDLANVLLRSDGSLSRGERELIAAHVSGLNECNFCAGSHGAFAAAQLEGGWGVVDAVDADLSTAPVSAKMRGLLAIAASVQAGGKSVTSAQVEAARAAGATDVEIHDAVLIAAAFCMYNRYVDGLGTWAPPDREMYTQMAGAIVEHGYSAALQDSEPPA